MFPHALAGARAVGLALLAAALLAACGSDDSPSTPAATPAASRLVLDTGSAAPVAGGTLTLKATLLAADGTEIKGASFAWTSSDPSVATVVSASDKAPAASVIAPVGIYATVQTLAAGVADITVTATLPGGGGASGITHLVVQAAQAKSYTLALTPATLAVTAGGAAQTVSVAVRRSDGVDGIGDLTNWSWTSDDASFVATPAADSRSAQVASPASATAAGAATLTACADSPAGGRLCANAALSRNASLPPTYTVGGIVSGLIAGTSLQLADTNGDTQVISTNGGFTMPTPRLGATSYALSVAAQPAGQTCTVANGSGAVSAGNVTSIGVTCTRNAYAYVANNGSNTVSQYTIGADGTLSPMATPSVNAGSFPWSITVAPSGKYAYVANGQSNSVSQYTIGADGALTPMATASVNAGSFPWAITVAPSGKYAYVTNNVSNTVSQYTIGADGALTPMATASVNTGLAPNAVTVDPSGKYAYVGNLTDGTVSQYTIGADGALSPMVVASVSAIGAASVTVDPSGKYAYVANIVSNTVLQYTIDANGALSPMAIASVGAGSNPISVTVDPSGKYAYVANNSSNTVSQYTIGADGALSPMAGASVNVGLFPTSVAVDPSGKYAYVVNNQASTVSQFMIGADGALSLIATLNSVQLQPSVITTTYAVTH
ncbi:beta-propeller fold lactonase family protein [Cupriavidus pauculus]|uniref:Lactonase family protein n=1 Tax=Cupriavidus pauculus TaxID=82633 RepID=A0A2N5C897_9BURK|nr:beta-propeller fold lactonase family protein [Cupriavidus pauculus]PLP98435.1 hypothetical protein CYJ10_21305 [Cupriavidus pauculus]